MKLKSRFDIHSIVRRKFDNSDKIATLIVYQVMEIHSQTYYAGTQIFYLCRPNILNYIDSSENKWIISHGTGKDDHNLGWKKYREDELVKASKEIIEVFYRSIQKTRKLKKLKNDG